MEDRGGEHGARMALADALDQMIERADAARGDDRHRDRVGNGARQRDIEAQAGAVAVHGGQQQFAGAERHDLARKVDGIDAGRLAAAMGEDFPSAGRRLLGIDRDDDALAAEFLRRARARKRGRSRRRY